MSGQSVQTKVFNHLYRNLKLHQNRPVWVHQKTIIKYLINILFVLIFSCSTRLIRIENTIWHRNTRGVKTAIQQYFNRFSLFGRKWPKTLEQHQRYRKAVLVDSRTRILKILDVRLQCKKISQTLPYLQKNAPKIRSIFGPKFFPKIQAWS